MSKKRHHSRAYLRLIAPYMEYVRNALNLNDWRVVLGGEFCDPGYSAQVEMTYRRKVARITLSKHWHNQTPQQQRQTIVHELLHLHMRVTDNVMRNMEVAVSPKAFPFMWESYTDANEQAVDALAAAFAALMPLPPVYENKRSTKPS